MVASITKILMNGGLITSPFPLAECNRPEISTDSKRFRTAETIGTTKAAESRVRKGKVRPTDGLSSGCRRGAIHPSPPDFVSNNLTTNPRCRPSNALIALASINQLKLIFVFPIGREKNMLTQGSESLGGEINRTGTAEAPLPRMASALQPDPQPATLRTCVLT